MKKLMFVAAVMAAGVCLSDITSNNIVGYTQDQLRWGVSLQTPQFAVVGGGNYKLEDIKPVGEDLSGNLQLDLFDDFGAPEHTYGWIEWGRVGTGKYWSEDYQNPAEGVTLSQGQGYSITASSNAQFLQTAGEVETKDLTYQLRWGVSLCGNSFPVEVALQDILPSGEDLSGNLQLDLFDDFGAPEHTYGWIEWGRVGTGKYWSEDYQNPAEGVVIAPGEGFSLTASSSSQYITIPAPEL